MADQKKSPVLLIGALAVIVIAAAGWFFTQGGGSTQTAVNAQEGGSEAAAVASGEGRPDLYLGDADAPIEMIEYASYTCPHCAAFHTEIYPQLKAEYIDTGKVKFIMREVYFDQFGLAGGLIARCGGDVRYYGIVDLLFKKQSEWARGEGDAVVQGLYRIGRQAGLENDQMQACLQDKELSEALVEDYRVKAAADEVSATPSFVINGEKYANQGWDSLKAVLDEKLN